MKKQKINTVKRVYMQDIKDLRELIFNTLRESIDGQVVTNILVTKNYKARILVEEID